jgi:hypothetical protein
VWIGLGTSNESYTLNFCLDQCLPAYSLNARPTALLMNAHRVNVIFDFEKQHFGFALLHPVTAHV